MPAWDGRVYEIDPKSMKIIRRLDEQIRFTNGIAFGPDNSLYANASFTGEIYRYDVFGRQKRSAKCSAMSCCPMIGRFSGDRTE